MKVSILANELNILSGKVLEILTKLGIDAGVFTELNEEQVNAVREVFKTPRSVSKLRGALGSKSKKEAEKTPKIKRKVTSKTATASGAESSETEVGKKSTGRRRKASSKADPAVDLIPEVQEKQEKPSEGEKKNEVEKPSKTVKEKPAESIAEPKKAESHIETKSSPKKVDGVIVKRTRKVTKVDAKELDEATIPIKGRKKATTSDDNTDATSEKKLDVSTDKATATPDDGKAKVKSDQNTGNDKESEEKSAKKGLKKSQVPGESEALAKSKPAKKERKRTKWDVMADDSDDDGASDSAKAPASVIIKRVLKKSKKKSVAQPEKEKHVFNPRKKSITIGANVKVGELAGLIGIKAAEIIKVLMQLGVMAGINQSIDSETAQLVATEFNVDLTIKDSLSFKSKLDVEENKPEDLVTRPPVVTIMGHVDHGKTSLLDVIRKSTVTSGEAGGITQHIGAYYVSTSNGSICFLDTPGHAAFTAMRARGANVTDVVILVVAANDGPMPQTVEAISHARAADVPIIVAINKCDLPDANPDKTIQMLMEHGLVAEEYGGDVTMVKISAKQNQGINELYEILILQAETMELKANPKKKASGVVIESKVDKGRGVVVSVLVQSGVLNKGDFCLVGAEYGKIRIMLNEHGKEVKSAGLSMPVEIVGLNGLPKAGDFFQVGSDEKSVRLISEERKLRIKEEEEAQNSPAMNLENFFQTVQQGEKSILNLIIKSDVIGSVEAIADSLKKLGNDEVGVSIIHSSVGAISNSDVTLAAASSAVVIGFNVRPDSGAKKMAQQDGVQVKLYSIIYNIIDDVKKSLEGMLEPIIREEFIGKAEVLEVFNMPKIGVIAGCKVLEGKVTVNTKVRQIRDNIILKETSLKTLKRFKDDANEVQEGFECGITLDNVKDVRQKDVFEFFIRVEEAAKL